MRTVIDFHGNRYSIGSIYSCDSRQDRAKIYILALTVVHIMNSSLLINMDIESISV
jgi:hypothetical protein